MARAYRLDKEMITPQHAQVMARCDRRTSEPEATDLMPLPD
jgi:hypothetical protein